MTRFVRSGPSPASIRGRERPDELVIVGNHRDAWVYGGVDPSSGSAALVELARTLGQLARDGWRPKRSILFASWDAEEFTLTSSTEWGEEHEAKLRDNAVAYLNVDSAASGPNFAAAAVPSLNRLIAESAQMVRDPRMRIPIPAAARSRRAEERGALPTGSGDELVNNRLGSGSDYTVFLNFLGIPIADLSFDGPYGVYHSMYDNHNWVSRIGDPGFRYHVALVSIWGIAAMRLANADALPIDPSPYAERLRQFMADVRRRPAFATSTIGQDLVGALRDVDSAIEALASPPTVSTAVARQRFWRPTSETLAAVNRQALRFERAFLSPDGIPGRPWYRHLVYAPKFTYAPELLPGVSEALDAEAWSRAARTGAGPVRRDPAGRRGLERGVEWALRVEDDVFDGPDRDDPCKRADRYADPDFLRCARRPPARRAHVRPAAGSGGTTRQRRSGSTRTTAARSWSPWSGSCSTRPTAAMWKT